MVIYLLLLRLNCCFSKRRLVRRLLLYSWQISWPGTFVLDSNLIYNILGVLSSIKFRWETILRSSLGSITRETFEVWSGKLKVCISYECRFVLLYDLQTNMLLLSERGMEQLLSLLIYLNLIARTIDPSSHTAKKVNKSLKYIVTDVSIASFSWLTIHIHKANLKVS